MGMRPSNTTELILDNVRVHESMRIGREGEGFKIAMKTLDAARPLVGAVAVGLADAALQAACKYAKERQQFGKPIASFQMVQGMIADMAMAVETARLMVYKACWMKDQGMDYKMESAMQMLLCRCRHESDDGCGSDHGRLWLHERISGGENDAGRQTPADL